MGNTASDSSADVSKRNNSLQCLYPDDREREFSLFLRQVEFQSSHSMFNETYFHRLWASSKQPRSNCKSDDHESMCMPKWAAEIE